MPAVRTMRPCGASRDLGRGERAAACASCSRRSASGWRRSVSDERPVVGDDVLAFGRRGERGSGLGERAAGEQRRQPLDAGDVPRRAVAMAGERRERVGVGEARRGRGGRAPRDARDRRRRRTAARAARSTIRCAPASESPAIIRRPRRSAGSRGDASRRFQRAVPLAHRHVDRPHLDAVPARVLHELRGRVEAHRLRVEQRARRTPPGS